MTGEKANSPVNEPPSKRSLTPGLNLTNLQQIKAVDDGPAPILDLYYLKNPHPESDTSNT